MMGTLHKLLALKLASVAILSPVASASLAQTANSAQVDDAVEQPNENGDRGASSLLGEIVVTATKQSSAQINQRVPVAITALNGDQLEALKIKDITSLATSIPSVSFEQTTAKATANFSIRGLGVNSSRISTAPAVGVFVNGVYLGINTGLIFDPFDIQGIEVLRGPQGTLFGRNVTGGAVLLNYQRPRQEPDFVTRARVESGPSYNIAVAGGGGLSDSLSARVAIIYDNDRGYFNAPLINDDHYGASETFTIRPSLRFQSGGTDVTVFAEYGRVTGDGPVGYAPDYMGGTTTTPGTLPAPGLRYSDILVQERGDTFIEWYAATLDARQAVDFGDDASITSVTGYRRLENFSRSDVDSVPRVLAVAAFATRQRQFSEELRYNGTFGRATLTTGLYFFHQNAEQYSRQVAINSSQGGLLKEDIFGVFGQVDYKLTEQLTLQLGGRYTHERKSTKIASLASENPNVIQPGTNGVPGSCRVTDRNGPNECTFAYTRAASFSNFSPKFSVQYQLEPRTLIYASAQRAYRSGGFNTSQNSRFEQSPYDPEKQTVYEIGFKADLFDRTTRLNGAAYLTKIKGLQRDVTQFDPVTLTTAQQTLNTADATIKGFELELVQQIIPKVVLTGLLGYTDARYDLIRFDITQDPAAAGGPMVTSYDYQQRIPRVLPWTYGLGLTADHDFAAGTASLRASWNHRDGSFFPDYNFNRRDGAVPEMPAADIFDLSVSFEPKGNRFSFSIYGRNLTNELTLGNFTPIAYPNVKGCACYVNKGRILGVEVKFKL